MFSFWYCSYKIYLWRTCRIMKPTLLTAFRSKSFSCLKTNKIWRIQIWIKHFKPRKFFNHTLKLLLLLCQLHVRYNNVKHNITTDLLSRYKWHYVKLFHCRKRQKDISRQTVFYTQNVGTQNAILLAINCYFLK